MSGAYPALSAALSCPALSTSSPFLVPAAHTTAISLEERENVVEQETEDVEKSRIRTLRNLFVWLPLLCVILTMDEIQSGSNRMHLYDFYFPQTLRRQETNYYHCVWISLFLTLHL